MLLRRDFSDLPGFEDDNHAESWPVLFRSCEAVAGGSRALRPGLPHDPPFRSLCLDVLAAGRSLSATDALAFYRKKFAPFLVSPDQNKSRPQAFLTAYYRPSITASFLRTPDFSEPLYARPADLVSFLPEHRPAHMSGLAAGRIGPDGAIEPYPTRAQINRGALRNPEVLAYVADPIEAFMIHVQGSARLEIQGRFYDLTYAGRNGHAYVSIGRILTVENEIVPSDMSLARLKEWVRRNGQGPGERGRALLERNPSFIFFSLSPAIEADGPVGAAGLGLTPFRSIAVDRAVWPYGMPFWIDTQIPWQVGREASRFSRMMIAQDTGSAILGPARADLFFGTGDQAGLLAGNIRHYGQMFVFKLAKEAAR